MLTPMNTAATIHFMPKGNRSKETVKNSHYISIHNEAEWVNKIVNRIHKNQCILNEYIKVIDFNCLRDGKF